MLRILRQRHTLMLIYLEHCVKQLRLSKEEKLYVIKLVNRNVLSA
jgi:hypothetical protein